jgi:hypothetical protein
VVKLLLLNKLEDSIIPLKLETDKWFNRTKTNKLVFQQHYQLLVKKYVINEWDQNFDKHFTYLIYVEYLRGNAY